MENNIFEAVAETVSSRLPSDPRPSDYTDPATGLLMCEVCGEPRQHRLHIPGRDRIVSCACKCMREEWAEREAEDKATEERKRIEELRKACIPDPGLRAKTFGSSTPTRQLTQAMKYVEAWKQMREHNIGMLFWGGPGSGKTHTAACVVNALIGRGIRAGITSTADLLAVAYNDRSAELRRLISLELLALDDWGAERDSTYAMETVYAVIDGRLRAGRPMVITTNLSLQDVRNPGDMARERIYQRVLEGCQPVGFDGPSRRPGITEEKHKILAEVFGGASNG